MAVVAYAPNTRQDDIGSYLGLYDCISDAASPFGSLLASVLLGFGVERLGGPGLMEF